jgi:hypothetical protein
MSDEERDRRSGAQWMRSVRAYLNFRAGDAWRRGTDRWASERWYYIDAIRLLNEIPLVRIPQISVTPATTRAIRINSVCSERTVRAMVDELMQLRPELTLRRTLTHLHKVKLAQMIVDARAKADQRTERIA